MRKNLYFTAPGKVEIKTEPIPELKKNECLIQNRASLISPGTELALFTGTHVGFKDPEISWAKYPLLPGYAAIGEVLKINGKSELKPGDNIMYYGLHSSHGIIKPNTDIWTKIPNSLSEESLFGRFAQISSTVPYLTRNEKKTGNVLVFGAGLIGNFCAQLFQIDSERKVIIADISDNRLSLAAECNIKYQLNTASEDPQAVIKRITEDKGVDIIVEATGVPELVPKSLELVNPMGAVYLLGSSRGDVSINAYKLIHRKGTSLIGAHESVIEKLNNDSSRDPIRSQLHKMMNYLITGKIKANGMITHRISPDQAEEYYNHLLTDPDNFLGVLIKWSNT